MTNSLESFWGRVEILDASNCWEWQGTRHPRGYGKFSLRGNLWVSSRLAYTLSIGPIPEGMMVRHTCDNPPCCNPAHLLLGTHQDNMDDMMKRGRYVKISRVGSANGRSKSRRER